MYGLMLPSGNDAALVIASFFGGLLRPRKEEYDKNFTSLVASEVSVSETDGDGDNASTDGEEVKIGYEPKVKASSTVQLSARDTLSQRIARLDVPSSLGQH